MVPRWESVSTCKLTALPNVPSLIEVYSFLHSSSSRCPALCEELELRIHFTVPPSGCRPNCSLGNPGHSLFSPHLRIQLNSPTHEHPLPAHVPRIHSQEGVGSEGVGPLFKCRLWLICGHSVNPNTCAFCTAKTLGPEPQLVSPASASSVPKAGHWPQERSGEGV